jgi:hypothetical protein
LGEIVIDTRHEDERLSQTNDFTIDVLSVTSFPEDDVGRLKQVLLETGDKFRDWGRKMQCERVASIQSKVERERINLVIRRDRLVADSQGDSLSECVEGLVERCSFIQLPGSSIEGPALLERVIRF